MKHQICIRPLIDEDANLDCPFPETDLDTYLIYANALTDDIAQLSDVNSCEFKNNTIFIDTSLNQQELKRKIKHLFRRELCHLRYKGISTQT